MIYEQWKEKTVFQLNWPSVPLGMGICWPFLSKRTNHNGFIRLTGFMH